MSKSEFARRIGVVPSRITAMIKSGLIGADALVGEGRSARILVALAIEQIRTRRHSGQALGNGLATRLEQIGAGRGRRREIVPAPGEDIAALLQAERLESERRKNRMAAIEEAQRAGRLVPVADLEREVGRVVQDLVSVFMGMAPDIANAVAARFSLTSREVLFETRRVMNERRAAAAASIRAEAEAHPATRLVRIDTASSTGEESP